MQPKVLCFFAIIALVAAAPVANRRYIDQLQKEYEDDRYIDSTEGYEKVDDTQQQFEQEDEQNAEFKDFEQYQPKVDKSDEGIEQADYKEGIEQIDNGDDIEQTDDFEQVQHSTGDNIQEIEQVNEDTEPEEIEEVQQTDNDWNQQHETNENVEDQVIHFPQETDDLESDSAIGKLFGDSTVQEQESKYDDDQDQQQTQVGQEFNYNEEKLPVEVEVPSPSYKSNYGSGYSGVYQPSDPFEPEVYTQKVPWYKRVWAGTKDKARHFAHKVKETFGKK